MPSQPGPSRAKTAHQPNYAVVLTTRDGISSLQIPLTLAENEGPHDAFMCLLTGPGRAAEFNEAALIIAGPNGEELVHVGDAFRRLGDENHQWGRGTLLNAVLAHLPEFGWYYAHAREAVIARVNELRKLQMKRGLTDAEEAEAHFVRKLSGVEYVWLRPGNAVQPFALLSEAQIEGRTYRLAHHKFAVSARNIAEAIDGAVGTESAAGEVV